MRADITVSSPVVRSARVLQLAGMFDVPIDEKLSLSWSADLPIEDRPWNVGLITGPSGAGKTRLARHLWPEAASAAWAWSPGRALVDDFPAGMSIREITGLLSAVGLASPPAWLRPASTLPNGEAFRANMARLLAEVPDTDIAVVDEFTSVVDRQVAQVAPHAVQKTVRRAGRQFVAVTCHYDVEAWLQPDWAYDVAAGEFAWRQVQPHPRFDVAIHRADKAIWPLFARHHYLSADLHNAAQCFAAHIDGRPIAFASYIHFQHPRAKNIKTSHRVVVLPDWQGLGIAGRMSEWLGQSLAGQGFRFRATTAHPARIAYYARSPRWRLDGAKKSFAMSAKGDPTRARTQLDPRRLSLRTFEYVPTRPS
jgi:GNAT superfamily N-acetyltransferase